LMGTALYFLLEDTNPPKLIFVALAIALATIPNLGGRFVMPAAGMILAVLVGWGLSFTNARARVVLAVLIAIAFSHALTANRKRVVNYSTARSDFVNPLDSVYTGAAGIVVNSNTFLFIADLQNAVSIAEKEEKPLVIIPEFPSYWVTSTQENFMPLDLFMLPGTMPEELVGLIANKAEEQVRGKSVLVQKIHGTRFGRRERRVNLKNVKGLGGLLVKFNKIAETQYFEIYSEEPVLESETDKLED
ncbi:MAG: hypothetical protein GX811_10110, partial [Lentisphaerae bacterium]|nr:hypothetical protein [Lentisphaerota bacterium]